MRNVLVVTSSEWPIAELRAVLGDDVGELRVVVPAVRQSRLQWLTNAEDLARALNGLEVTRVVVSDR